MQIFEKICSTLDAGSAYVLITARDRLKNAKAHQSQELGNPNVGEWLKWGKAADHEYDFLYGAIWGLKMAQKISDEDFHKATEELIAAS